MYSIKSFYIKSIHTNIVLSISININIFHSISTDVSVTYFHKMVEYHIYFRDYFKKFINGNYIISIL